MSHWLTPLWWSLWLASMITLRQPCLSSVDVCRSLQIEQLKMNIAAEDRKAQALTEKARENSGVQEQEKTLHELKIKVI